MMAPAHGRRAYDTSSFLKRTPHKTVWPSGLRRWLKAPVRTGVGSNFTALQAAVTSAVSSLPCRQLVPDTAPQHRRGAVQGHGSYWRMLAMLLQCSTCRIVVPQCGRQTSRLHPCGLGAMYGQANIETYQSPPLTDQLAAPSNKPARSCATSPRRLTEIWCIGRGATICRCRCQGSRPAVPE